MQGVQKEAMGHMEEASQHPKNTLQSAEAILIGRAGLLQNRVDKQEKLQQYICRATIEKGNGGIRCVKFSRDSRNSEEKAKLV